MPANRWVLVTSAIVTMLLSTANAGEGCRWDDVFSDNAPDNVVRAMTVHDDGRGPALYVGGGFSQVGGQAMSRIARWDGTAWETLGDGVNADVEALAVWDDGTGPALYVGGRFTEAGGEPANRIARWDGSTWTALDSGLDGDVLALAAYDDGTRSRLYVGGRFTVADGQPATFLAAWDGTGWSPVGGGTNGFVFAPQAADNGFDPVTEDTDHRLWVGGLFQQAGETAVSNIAEWDGDRDRWFGLSTGTDDIVRAITQRTEGDDEVQYIGGDFNQANVIAFHIAKYALTQFIEPGDGTLGDVNALSVFDDGTGPGVYAAGEFQSASGTSANRIARWDGTAWSALDAGLSGDVLALAPFGSGSERSLYAGGWFLFANGQPSRRIARWLCADPLIFSDSFEAPQD